MKACGFEENSPGIWCMFTVKVNCCGSINLNPQNPQKHNLRIFEDWLKDLLLEEFSGLWASQSC